MIIDTHGHLIPPDVLNTIRKEGPKLPSLRIIEDAAGLALVPLVAPTSTDERLARIGERARGFLYTVSVTGTTGERAALADSFEAVVARAKACTSVPVALGFGIAAPDHPAVPRVYFAWTAAPAPLPAMRPKTSPETRPVPAG